MPTQNPLLRWSFSAALLMCAAAHAEVTTTVSSTGDGLAFGDGSTSRFKTVGIAGRSRIVDLDLLLDANASCDGAADNPTAAIAHARIGDISITLTSPGGTSVILMAQRGGARDNVCNLVFDDDAAAPSITAVTSINGMPLAGTYAPENPLSAFDGEDPNGAWTLQVSDNVAGVAGRFNRYSLLLQTEDVQDIVVDLLDDPAPNGCTAGSCSLREAVLLANARPGLDRIVLPAGELQLARAGADEDANDTGDLDVHDALEIAGQGMEATTLIQLVGDRLVHNVDASELILRALTLSGGREVDLGGAVRSRGRLVVRDARLAGNTAIVKGGGIHHMASGRQDGPPRIELLDSEFVDNRAIAAFQSTAYGGAVYVTSSGFQSDTGLVERSTFVRNEADHGGGALALDAIQNFSESGYTIRDSLFEDNRTTVSGRGGAIGTNVDENGLVDLTILGSSFTGNVATGTTPDDHGGGALAMYSGRLLRLADSLFARNEAGRGGAIQLSVDGLIEDSLFSDNRAEHGGGAIQSYDTLMLERSTLERNVVLSTDPFDRGGGGLVAGGDTDIRRSTFNDNVALRGGAITSSDGDLSLVHNTLSSRSGIQPPGAIASILRHVNTDASDTLVFNANLIIGSCDYMEATIIPDNSLYNIEASGNTCRLNLATLPINNRVSQSASALALAPLANNGGPTPTRLPLATSIAIDGASNASCPTLDQRGYERSDGTCDAGAVEASGVAPSVQLFADGFE